MAKIYKVWINQRLSEENFVTEKPWGWCEEQLGSLIGFRSKGPPLIVQPGDRPDLAAIRGPQHVVVHLEEPEPEHEPDYYLASISPQDLDRKLREG